MARIERVGGLRRLWCRFTTKNKQPLCGCRDDYRMVDGRGGWGLATRGDQFSWSDPKKIRNRQPASTPGSAVSGDRPYLGHSHADGPE